MGYEFTFYDYIDADNGGVNIIQEWLNNDGKSVKASFNRVIGYLEASPPGGSQDSVWDFPNTKLLENEWKDFREIRKEKQKVQYRLVCKTENRDVFLVTCGYHKGKWKMESTPQTAKDRVIKMKNNPEKYRREHDHS